MTTTNDGFVVGEEVPAVFTALVQPHVDSFDYFVGEGMELAVASMEPLEVRQPGRRDGGGARVRNHNHSIRLGSPRGGGTCAELQQGGESGAAAAMEPLEADGSWRLLWGR